MTLMMLLTEGWSSAELVRDKLEMNLASYQRMDWTCRKRLLDLFVKIHKWLDRGEMKRGKGDSKGCFNLLKKSIYGDKDSMA